jgi:hypothetical protein
MNEFETEIQIDKYSLDWEFERQPMLYHKYATLLTEAETKRDMLKNKIDVVHAQLNSLIRGNPKGYGLEKPTETAIESLIVQSDEYKNAIEEHGNAVYETKILKTAVESLMQKKTALENLVRLYLGEYYSKEVPKEVKEMQDKNVSEVIKDELVREFKDRGRI